jgi:hypothetical protein
MQGQTEEVSMRKSIASEFVALDGVMESPEEWRGAESDGMRVMRALLEDENLAERVLDRLSGEHGRGE